MKDTFSFIKRNFGWLFVCMFLLFCATSGVIWFINETSFPGKVMTGGMSLVCCILVFQITKHIK